MASAYLLVYRTRDAQIDLLLGRKHIYGVKARGERKDRPIVWNSCGRWVIPGGGADLSDVKGEASREFWEETGINLSDDDTRTAMKCDGDMQVKIFDARDRQQFGCAYQKVQWDSPLVNEAARYIDTIKVRDDELAAIRFIPEEESDSLLDRGFLEDNWQVTQFLSLNEELRLEAIDKGRMPCDWFKQAITHLVRVLRSRH